VLPPLNLSDLLPPGVANLAVAVSGGADSMALALLAQAWALPRGGSVMAYIIDHGLRAGSASEAAVTASRLAARGIGSRVIPLAGFRPGAGLQASARAARHDALAAAASGDGRLFLLLGHHAGDQAETSAMRAARGARGLEGMAAWRAAHRVVLLRPLLAVPPADLRAYLRAAGVAWFEDPSNAMTRFERVRVRLAAAGRPPESDEARRARELEAAAFLAGHATFSPAGYAVLDAASAPAAALGALLRVIAGAQYAPALDKVAALAAALRPATLGGVRITQAGRLGPGWLLTREPAACRPGVPAHAGVMWDRRFRLETAPPPGGMLAALGADAARFRDVDDLPSIVLRAQPCLRAADGAVVFPVVARFMPPQPATSLPFFNRGQLSCAGMGNRCKMTI